MPMPTARYRLRFGEISGRDGRSLTAAAVVAVLICGATLPAQADCQRPQGSDSQVLTDGDTSGDRGYALNGDKDSVATIIAIGDGQGVVNLDLIVGWGDGDGYTACVASKPHKNGKIYASYSVCQFKTDFRGTADVTVINNSGRTVRYWLACLNNVPNMLQQTEFAPPEKGRLKPPAKKKSKK